MFSKLLCAVWKDKESLLEGFELIVKKPIKRRSASRKWNTNYIGPFLLSLYLTLETAYLYVTFGYDLSKILFCHHCILNFMGPHFRSQADLSFMFSYALSITIYLMLIFNRMKHVESCILFPVPNTLPNLRTLSNLKGDKNVRPELSKKLLKFYNRVKPKLKQCSSMTELEINFAFAFPTFFFELYRVFSIPGYSINLRYLYCAVLIMVYGRNFTVIVLMGMNFIVTNIYLNIKQIFIFKENRKCLKKTNFRRVHCFRSTLRLLLRHTKEIEMLNRFFSPLISLLIFWFSLIGNCLLM